MLRKSNNTVTFIQKKNCKGIKGKKGRDANQYWYKGLGYI